MSSTGKRARGFLSVLIAVLVAAGTLIGLSVAPAQATDGGSSVTISGTVSAPPGQTLGSWGYVTAYTQDGEQVGIASFSSDGVYTMNPSPGEYKLQVLAYGFLAQWYKAGGNVRDEADAGVVDVTGGDQTVSIPLVAGVTISGTVSAPAGHSLESLSSLTAYTSDGDYAGDGSFTSDGSYSLSVMPGEYKLKIWVSGFPTQWYQVGGNVGSRADAGVVDVTGGDQTVDMTLSAGNTISGTVSPPAGQTLESRGSVTAFTSDGDQVGVGPFSSNGAYAIKVMPGEYKLNIEASGFPDQWYKFGGNVKEQADAGVVTVSGSDLTLNVTLVVSRISGTVSAPAGHSVESGGSVRAYTPDGDQVGVGFFSSNGDFTLGVWPGEYKLNIETNGDFPDQWYKFGGNVKEQVDAGVVDATDADQTVDMTLAGNQISGTVSAPAGHSVESGGSVWAYTPDGEYGVQASFGSDGIYTLGVWPGEYKLNVSASGFPYQWYKAGGNVSNRADADVVDATGDDQEANPILAVGVTISGKVDAPEGRSLGSGGSVYAYAPDGDYTPDGDYAGDGYFDSDGSYSLNVLPGEYKLKIYTSGDFPTQWHKAGGNVGNRADAGIVDVSIGDQTVNTTLAVGTTIRGTVGAPPGQTLGSWGYVDAYTPDGDYAGDGYFDSDGSYSLNVTPGEYKLEIYTGGDFPAQWYKAGGNVEDESDAGVVTVSGSDLALDIPLVATFDVATVPGAPSGLSATAGDGTASLTWMAPADDGGSPILGYKVQYQAGGLGDWVDVTDGDGNPADLGATIGGLSNGTAYAFRVVVTNAVGDSVPSGGSDSVTPKGVQSIVFDQPGDVVVGSGEVGLTASATSGLPVAFTSGTPDVCTVTGDTVTIIRAGNCTITASQAGDGVWNAASDVVRTFQVTSAPAPVTPVAPAPVPVSTPAAPTPAPVPVPAAQAPAGGVPSVAKAKGKKPVKLPTRTNAGQAVKWLSATPKVCKVVKGKLKLTGKKGMCRLTGAAPATGGFEALRQSYAIRVK